MAILEHKTTASRITMGLSALLHQTLVTLILYYLISLSAEAKSIPAGSTEVLHCSASLPNLLRRTWTKGYFNDSHPPSDKDVLFILIAPPGPLTRVNARDDMDVDKQNFTLTIGEVKYEDTGYFTCIAEDFVGTKNYAQSEEIVVDASTVLELEENTDAVFRSVFGTDSIAMRYFLRGLYKRIPSDNSVILLRQIGNQLPELPSQTQNLSLCLPEFNVQLHRVAVEDSGFYTALQMSELGDLSSKFIKLIVRASTISTTPADTISTTADTPSTSTSTITITSTNTPTTTTTETTTEAPTTPPKVYIDCQDAYEAGMTASGVYRISLNSSNIIDVYCDQEIDDGGWTVFQRRMDGSVDFYRDWADYQKGFGNLLTEFWLGNDNIHLLTANQDQKLKVELDYKGKIAYANYSRFWIGDEDDKYTLHYDGYTGAHPPGDSLAVQKGQNFTTRDNDNDRSSGNCAEIQRGAWWYKFCSLASNLNGKYGYNQSYWRNMRWWTFQQYDGMTATRMMVKRG